MSFLQVSLAAIASLGTLQAQSFLDELKAERDPGRRSELALALADNAFDMARDF
jgi:hypothetical protein